ncbi:hypothetical protein G7K_4903-t1 [Saitoella complicata NRRL Y-17804]|uniref:Uncharacterized protein n=2 Tax=Saitoella complicata (strain BCRC 22490 / CBS 7301 / JCM 7358 / NBRC 10748 / NRRL Y-17804) TaxID=698492 RepID=A0A0E9NLM4_SAICN|nr:hypothetical protein G7K_4903-t1 [Saitoella complicata NRRL Y-17804]
MTSYQCTVCNRKRFLNPGAQVYISRTTPDRRNHIRYVCGGCYHGRLLPCKRPIYQRVSLRQGPIEAPPVVTTATTTTPPSPVQAVQAAPSQPPPVRAGLPPPLPPTPAIAPLAPVKRSYREVFDVDDSSREQSPERRPLASPPAKKNTAPTEHGLAPSSLWTPTSNSIVSTLAARPSSWHQIGTGPSAMFDTSFLSFITPGSKNCSETGPDALSGRNKMLLATWDKDVKARRQKADELDKLLKRDVAEASHSSTISGIKTAAEPNKRVIIDLKVEEMTPNPDRMEAITEGDEDVKSRS